MFSTRVLQTAAAEAKLATEISGIFFCISFVSVSVFETISFDLLY